MLCHGEAGAGTNLSVALGGDLAFKLGVVWLVQHGSHLHIQGVNDAGGIPRHVIDLQLREDAQFREFFFSNLLKVLVKQIALLVEEKTADGSHPKRWHSVFSVVCHGHIPETQGVGGVVLVVLQQGDARASHVVSLCGSLGD